MTQDTTYFGGKSGSGTYQTIINQIPPHRLYVEGFAGMAGIFRKKIRAQQNLLIDRDRSVIHRLIKAGVSTTDLYEGSFFQVAQDFIADLDKEDTFIYLDPPYPLESRKSGTKYKFELDFGEHVKLLELITMDFTKAKIAISTYPNRSYTSHLEMAGWRMIEFESQTRHGKAIEQLWMNYPEPSELHDYRYLGTDYRERERITRKLKRWEAKFEDLAPLEKQAMLLRLNAKIKKESNVQTRIESKTAPAIVQTAKLDLSQAPDMYAQGMSLKEIADHYGISFNKLTAELRRNNIWPEIKKALWAKFKAKKQLRILPPFKAIRYHK